MDLTVQEQGILLMSARSSIMASFSGNPGLVIDYGHYTNLQQPCGAFVTLIKNGELRGSMGYFFSEDSLFLTVCEAAKLAAFEDPRFEPLQIQEIPEIQIEISVLSPPQSVTSYDDIEMGRDGLMLDEGPEPVILLPQVAFEQKMNISGFLSALCVKAGLAANEWMSRPIKLKKFSSQLFREKIHRNLTGEAH